jgi:hypothetical protein
MQNLVKHWSQSLSLQFNVCAWFCSSRRDPFPWPSACNNANVWIWIQMSSSEFSVGTGPVIGQNVAASTTVVTGIPAAYVGVYNYGFGSPTIYLY